MSLKRARFQRLGERWLNRGCFTGGEEAAAATTAGGKGAADAAGAAGAAGADTAALNLGAGVGTIGEGAAAGAGAAGAAGAADAIDVGVPGFSSPASAAGAGAGAGAATGAAVEGGSGGAPSGAAAATPTALDVGVPGLSSEASAGLPGIDVGSAATGLSGAEGFGSPAIPASSFDPTAYETGVSTQAAQAAGTAAAESAPAAAEDSIIQRIIAQAKANPLTAGALGLNTITGLGKLRQGDALAKQLAAQGKPASDVAHTLLDQYKSGQIPSSTAFDIQKWQDQAIAAARQRYAGMGNSSALQHEIANIQAQAQAMTDRARQGLLQSGLTALGVGNGPLAQAAMAEANADTNFTNAQGSALNSLMLLQAMKSKGAAAPAG